MSIFFKRKFTVKYFFKIVVLFTVILLIGQVFFSNILINQIRQIHRSNTNIVMQYSISNSKNTIGRINDAVTYLARDNVVIEYAQIRHAGRRYLTGYEQIRTRTSATIQQTGIEYLLIQNITGSWQDFSSTQFNIDHRLRAEIIASVEARGINDPVNQIIIFDEVSYIYTISPIFSVTPTGIANQVGNVIAVKNINTISNAVNIFEDNLGISIHFHDLNQVLASSSRELNGILIQHLRKQLVNEYNLEEEIIPNQLGVIVSLSNSTFNQHQLAAVMSFLSLAAFSVIMLLFLSTFISKMIVRPIAQVVEETSGLGYNYKNMQINPTGIAHVDQLVMQINLMLIRVDDYSNKNLQQQQNLHQLELRHKETQLWILRTQINHHFLYNSLISIKVLTNKQQYKQIEELVEGVAHILQYATSQDVSVSLFDELEIIKNYVDVKNLITDDEVLLQFDLDDRLLDFQIPKLLLQPLVENVFIHAFGSLQRQAVLNVNVFIEKGDAVIEIKDNGVGIDEALLDGICKGLKEDSDSFYGKIGGISLQNIHKRIVVAYGDGYGINILSKVNAGTKVVLRLPFKEVL